ncbi:MAG: hypothetical protein ABIK62_06835, partial [candidate division WOR-3 bacterium]
FDLVSLLGLTSRWAAPALTQSLQDRPGRLLATIWRSYPELTLVSIAGLLYLGAVYTGIVSFLGRGVRTYRGAEWTVLILIAYFLVMSSGPEASARFRVPMMPFLALLGAAGWKRRLDT